MDYQSRLHQRRLRLAKDKADFLFNYSESSLFEASQNSHVIRNARVKNKPIHKLNIGEDTNYNTTLNNLAMASNAMLKK